MPFRTILAVTGLRRSDADLVAAADLCQRAAAHLSVLVAAIAMPPPIGRYAAAVSDAWRGERENDMRRLRRRVEEVRHLLTGTAASVEVDAEYPELTWADDAIGRRARYTDLVLVGPELHPGSDLRSKVIEGVLFSSGRPLLLVPGDWRVTLAPRKVMVGWDGSFEAARAVREALEMLVGATEVRLVLVDPVEGEPGHGPEPGADAAAHLARHGAKVTVERLPSEGRPVADILRRHAIDTSSEMLVMGAYGHSRLREFIFGGVTKSMLADPPVPILMAR